MASKRIKILVAKPGLDGHDRGAKIIALALRDAGMEVIYSGLHQSIDQIISAAIQEAVDIIGLSIMTGAHMTICEKLINKLQEQKMTDVHLIVGGVIPKQDIARLREIGVEGVFPNGTLFSEIISSLQELV